MKCSNCGFENPAGARFCMNCGTSLASTPEDEERLARLRSAVPQPLAQKALAARGVLEGERRQVTILFADVVGSTAMAEKRDPEEAKVILEECLTLVMEQVHRYEGFVVNLMGDGLLAFFGAPIAHEDDSERGVRAALGIQESVRAYAQELEKAYGITLQVRVGLNTGTVVVGEMGSDLHMQYTAIGDSVNLAARVQAAAPPGEVLITGSTYRLVSRLFQFGALGEIEVRGREEPVEAYLVTGVITEPVRVRGIEGLRSPMVGRDQEREKLLAVVENLLAGKGQIVAVIGEAGIGKTRLVEEVREATAGKNILWLEGRALSYGQSLSLWMFQEVVRRYLGISEGESQALMRVKLKSRVRALFPDREAEILPYLASLLLVKLEGEMAERVADIHPEALKRRIFVVVGELFERVAREQAVVLVLEDLHWADPTSIELLKGLLASTDRAPIMLLCLLRPEREEPCWKAILEAQTRYPHRYTEIALQPLPAEESRRLVENLLALEELPKGIKGVILEKAEGNPFFLEEVIRALIEEGVLVQQDGRWRATARALSVEIPDTVQGVIRARIDRLPEEPKQVLQVASVIGKTFLYSLLERVSQMDGMLGEHLATLQRLELIVEKARRPELEYIFKHVLTREVAYQGLLLERRREFHRRVAEAIESLFPDRLEEFQGMLGYHWSEAGEGEKAVKYLLQAGDRARLAYAYQEAEDYYHHALKHLRKAGDGEQVAKTLMKLGLVYQISGNYERVTQCYEEAFRIWQPETPATVLSMPREILKIVATRPVSNLDPGLATTLSEGRILGSLFEGLVHYDAEGNLVPAVARSWEISEGGTRYLFHLRPDIYWSDGRPLKAMDFEYAWRRNLDPSTAAPMASLLYSIRGARALHRGETGNADQVGVHALDDLTLEVHLEVPTPYFLHLITHTITYPVPRWAIEAHGERWTQPDKMVCNGPFRLLEHTPELKVVLERNDAYFDALPGNLAGVEFLFSTDPSGSMQQYKTGEVDLTWVHSEEGKIIETYPSEAQFFGILATDYLAFVVSQQPFDDARVRRAFAQATNRKALAALREGFLATGGLIPPGLAGHSAEIGLPHDPDLARRLLAEAGYPDGKGFPAVKLLEDGRSSEEASLLAAQWQEELGVEVVVSVGAGEGVHKTLREHPPHIYLHGWALDYPDPDNILRVVFHSRSPENDTRWRSAEYDRLVDDIARLSDQAERMVLYRQAEEILVVKEAVVMPLSYHRELYLVRSWIKGFSVNPLGQIDLRQVVIEPH